MPPRTDHTHGSPCGLVAVWPIVLQWLRQLGFATQDWCDELTVQIEIHEERIAAFCRANRVRKLWLFGSVLNDRFGPESDVDVLVEFEPGAKIGFLDMASMQIELTGLLGRRVDLRTPAEISRHFRQEVIDAAELQYVRG